jgi:hypothetical protein
MKKLFLIISLLLITLWVNAANYYVSTTGNDATGDGSIGNPWFDPEYAALQLVAGDILYIRGGVYYGVNTHHYGGGYDDIEILYIDGVGGTLHSGTALNPITMINYPGETVIFNGSQLTGAWYRHYGIYLKDCDYWIIKGITITQMVHLAPYTQYCPQGLFLYSCQYCIIELCKVCHTQGRGFDMQQPVDDVGDRHSTGNRFLNCDAYDNYDLYTTPQGNNGDGFGCTLTHEGCINYISGCRSWNNSDDGYDMILNDGVVELDNCWSWGNGRGTNGNGTGFKFGDLRLLPPNANYYRIAHNCIAFMNRNTGFDANGIEGKVNLYNNVSYKNNPAFALGFNWSGAGDVANLFQNNIADSNCVTGDNYDVNLLINAVHDHNSWNMSPNWNVGFRWRTDIESLDQFFTLDTAGVSTERQPDGSLPYINFMRLKAGSVYIDAGVDVGLTYLGAAPDLGAFEYDEAPPEDIEYATVLTDNIDVYNIWEATIGGNAIADGGASITAKGLCWDTSNNPIITDNRTSNGVGTGTYSASITGLQPGTTYYVRAYATNSKGTSYGLQRSFTTPLSSVITSGGKVLIFNGLPAIWE